MDARLGVAAARDRAYSLRHTARVDPVFLLQRREPGRDCEKNGTQGVLRVNDREPVQLSVPSSIGRAPWRLLKVYEDQAQYDDDLVPSRQSAVTIPTVDEQRGKVVGVVVQLMTLVRDQSGEVFDLPHAEWSVRLTGTDPRAPQPSSSPATARSTSDAPDGRSCGRGDGHGEVPAAPCSPAA